MRLPVLAGPTASGKTDLSLELARHYPLEIISADAMLIYRGMDIGTAKPSLVERAAVPHHLIDIVNPDEAFSVADYVAQAEAVIAEVLARRRIPLVVGGTGFYIRALSEGLATVPPADMTVQAPLWQRLEREGLEPLLAELTAVSPEDAARAERNPRRVIRALEIIQRTGRAPKSFPFTTPKYRYAKVALMPEVEDLRARITLRTETMFAAGLVEEVKTLLERYPLQPTAVQAIGYKEGARYLRGEGTLEGAKEAVTLATVQYAKRQRTWFRKEPGVTLAPTHAETLRTLHTLCEDVAATLAS